MKQLERMIVRVAGIEKWAVDIPLLIMDDFVELLNKYYTNVSYVFPYLRIPRYQPAPKLCNAFNRSLQEIVFFMSLNSSKHSSIYHSFYANNTQQ